MDMTLVVCFYQLHIQVVVIITGLELHKRPSLLSGQISDARRWYNGTKLSSSRETTFSLLKEWPYKMGDYNLIYYHIYLCGQTNSTHICIFWWFFLWD